MLLKPNYMKGIIGGMIRRNRNINMIIIMLTGLLTTVITFILLFYYIVFQNSNSISSIGQVNNYKRYYAVITENKDTLLWQQIFSSMNKMTNAYNAYVDYIGDDMSVNYSLCDRIQMAIASGVDGIILEPNDEPELKKYINKAVGNGIPVITVLRDIQDSERISYIGTNSYVLGQIYCDIVFNDIKNSLKQIYVLTSGNSDDKLIVTELREYMSKNINTDDLKVIQYPINHTDSFDADESIRSLITNKYYPSVIVCMTQEDTERVCQVVVDYNLVGKIQIIGRYLSNTIAKGIQKKIIEATIEVEATDIGSKCIQALSEYNDIGNVSEYYSINVHVVTNGNIGDYYDVPQ